MAKNNDKLIRALKKVIAADIDDEVEKAFLKAISDLKKMEWGSPEQIKSENHAFDIAKKHGWDADDDKELYAYSLKATTEEMLYKALECYRKYKNSEALADKCRYCGKEIDEDDGGVCQKCYKKEQKR